MVTTSTHKETTAGARKDHEETVVAMIEQLSNYMDPFGSGVARHLKTGEALEENIAKGLLQFRNTGENLLKQFVNERLMRQGSDRVSFFKPIQKPKLKTGLEKPRKVP